MKEYNWLILSILFILPGCNSEQKLENEEGRTKTIDKQQEESNIVIAINNKNKQLLQKGPAIIKFSAKWCGPCKVAKPIYEELATQYPTITFLEIDIDEMKDISKNYAISGVPTFILIDKDGTTKEPLRGFPGKTSLINYIEQLIKKEK